MSSNAISQSQYGNTTPQDRTNETNSDKAVLQKVRLSDKKTRSFSQKITAVTVEGLKLYAIVHRGNCTSKQSNELYIHTKEKDNWVLKKTVPITFCDEYLFELTSVQQGSFICLSSSTSTIHAFELNNNDIDRYRSFPLQEVLGDGIISNAPFKPSQIRKMQVLPQGNWLILLDHKTAKTRCLVMYNPSDNRLIQSAELKGEIIDVRYALEKIWILTQMDTNTERSHGTMLQTFNFVNNDGNNNYQETYPGQYSKIISEDGQFMVLSQSAYRYIVIIQKNENDICHYRQEVDGICHPCIINSQIAILSYKSIFLLNPYTQASVKIPINTSIPIETFNHSSWNSKDLSNYAWTLQKSSDTTLIFWSAKKTYTIKL